MMVWGCCDGWSCQVNRFSQEAALHSVTETGEVSRGLIALEQRPRALHLGIQVVEVMKQQRLGELGNFGRSEVKLPMVVI